MIGATIPSQVAAMQAVALTGFLLVYMFSGLLFPISNIPASIRWLSNFVWGRYYIEIVRDALLAGRRLGLGMVEGTHYRGDRFAVLPDCVAQYAPHAAQGLMS